jgi:release factor glutamine methyltransferase
MLCPETEVWLLEKYEEALRYLRANIPRSVTDRIHVVKADVFNYDPALLPAADLIVSNPPYISTEEIAVLQAEVQKEPSAALDGGTDGLAFYRCIADRWASAVRPGGCIALECGERQSAEIAGLFTAGKTEELRDMYGVKRFVFAECL